MDVATSITIAVAVGTNKEGRAMWRMVLALSLGDGGLENEVGLESEIVVTRLHKVAKLNENNNKTGKA